MWETRLWFVFWMAVIITLINLPYVIDIIIYLNHKYFPYFILSEVAIIHIIFAIIFSIFYRLFYKHRRPTLFSYLLFVGTGLTIIAYFIRSFPFS